MEFNHNIYDQILYEDLNKMKENSMRGIEGRLALNMWAATCNSRTVVKEKNKPIHFREIREKSNELTFHSTPSRMLSVDLLV